MTYETRQRGDKAAVCDGKQGLSRARAHATAAHVRKRRGDRVTPYECPFCSAWHLGSSLKGASR
jgi:hypothetical protein